MLAIRAPSSTSATGMDLGGDMARGLLSLDAAERGADRHADSRDVALAQHVARHDLAGGEDVSRRAIVLPDHLRPLVYRDAEVGEGDTRPQRIRKERRRIERPRPMALGRRQSRCGAIVEHGVIECSRADRFIELAHPRFERGGMELERQRKLAHGVGLNRREHWWNKLAHRVGIDNRVRDLIGLRGHEPAPDRVALGPEVEALVVEALRILVDDDAERHAIDAGADAAVELRRAGVDRNAMTLGRIADGFRAAVEEDPQDASHIVWRAADQATVGRGSPRFAQPSEVRLESAGRGPYG